MQEGQQEIVNQEAVEVLTLVQAVMVELEALVLHNQKTTDVMEV
jgi:hypothetical protein